MGGIENTIATSRGVPILTSREGVDRVRPRHMDPQKEESKLEDSRMALWQHLQELRGGLVRILVVLSVVSCFTYRYAEKLLYWLEKPLLEALPPEHRRLYFTGITDKFFVYLKASIYAAIALTIPYLLWEIWKFVSPGLYSKEKKMVLPFILFGSFFFLLGGCFGYWIVIPYGYQFLVNFGSSAEVPLITLSEYFTITLQLLMMMGAVFELPVVLMILAKFGVIQPGILRKVRGQAYIGLSVLAAFVTPTPDAFTMLLVMIPLFLLYEVSVLLVRWVAPPTS